MSDNFLALRRKFFGELVQTAFFVHIKTLQSSFFSEKNYSFRSFLYIELLFCTLWWNFSDEVVKTASYLFIGSFWWEKFFDEETLMFFIQFETFSDKFLAVCWEIFDRFVAISKEFYPTEKNCLNISFFHHLGQRSKKYYHFSHFFNFSSDVHNKFHIGQS